MEYLHTDRTSKESWLIALETNLNPLYPNDDYSRHEYRYVNSEWRL